MTVKVSVVVPVFNPGQHIAYCIDSLLAQSLPPEEFEAIFVDDGSTDETPEILDKLAAAHPNITVIHTPNSGWPGRPRNLGTDAATGRYVHYLDNDDALGPEALERLYDFAEANESDVIIGRCAGHHRAVAREIFRETRPSVTDYALLAATMTPHKMFRREFLDKHGIRFPEGRRRLEDHFFVTKAYLLADRISAYSDYVCYYHIRRDDATNAGFHQIVPSGYFGNLEEAMDVAEALTAPGADRDAFMRRWLRYEMLNRLNAPAFRSYDADYQRELFGTVHALAQSRITAEVRDQMAPAFRLRANLLHRGAVDALMAYGQHITGVKGTPKLMEATWRDGVLHIGFELRLVTADGHPVTFVEHDGRHHLDVPAELADGAVVSWADREAGDLATATKVDLVVRYRSDSAEFYTATEFDTVLETAEPGRTSLTHTGRANLDPMTWAGGEPLWDGIWDIYLRMSTCGLDSEVRLGSIRTPEAGASAGRVQLGDPDGRMIRPYWTEPHGNLSLNVGPLRSTPQRLTALKPDDVSFGAGGWPTVRLPFDTRPSSTDAFSIRLTNTVSRRIITRRGVVRDGSLLVVADGTGARNEQPTAGLWQISVVAPGRTVDTGTQLLAPVVGRRSIRHDGQPTSLGSTAAQTSSRLRQRVGRLVKGSR